MKWVKWLLLVIFVVLLISGVLNPVLAHLSDKNWLTGYLLQYGWIGHFSIALAALIFVGIGGPRQAISFIFGYLYGAVVGVAVAIAICSLAALANYMAARMVFAHSLAHHFPVRMHKFNQFASRAPFMKILTLRLLPVGSNLVTNLLSGSVGVPLPAFLCASVLGYFPQTLVFALIGGGIGSANHAMIYLSIGLSLLSFVLTALIYRDHLKHKLSKLNLENNA